MCLSVRFHSRKRQPRERDRGDGFEGGTRCPQRVGPAAAGRLRRMMFAPSVTIVAIVFGEADPPLM